MNPPNRRSFLKTAALTVAGTALATPVSASSEGPTKRRFTMDLACGRIGVRADLREAIRLAHEYGFESVEPSMPVLANMPPDEVKRLLEHLKSRDLTWGAAGLPVDFRGDDDRFQTDLDKLAPLASASRQAGVTRVGTWISPGHDQLTYVANFRRHAQRLRKVAEVLGEHGQRLGLEYVGPKTSWSARRFPFLHTMAEMKDLIAEIGCDNVGFVLDSWHWYTAGETVDDLFTLKNDEIVACDLNDAPAGIAVDEQIDNQRELPAATGTIDLKSFLGALVTIGYDGPVRAEPFHRELNDLDNEQAVAATAAAMSNAFALIEGQP